MNELFLDIVVNYREEVQYHSYLEPLASTAESAELDADEFKLYFRPQWKSQEPLITNILLLNLFNLGEIESVEDTIESYQLILEHI